MKTLYRKDNIYIFFINCSFFCCCIYIFNIFTYFTIGETIEEVTRRLGKKKVHVGNRGYEVLFYNKFSKRNELFEFRFVDGKLSSISRPSTNTLPTNNVWMAFKLLEMKDVLESLKKIR